MIDGTDVTAPERVDKPLPFKRLPDCPPWCVRHDGDRTSSIHFGEVHTVDLALEDHPVAVQIDEVAAPADLREPPAIYLAQDATTDGVKLELAEARQLATTLTDLADELEGAQTEALHPYWCENRDEPAGDPRHDHRSRVLHLDTCDYAFQAAVEAFDDPPDGLSDLYIAVSGRNCAFVEQPFGFKIPISEAGGLLDLLTRVVRDGRILSELSA